MWPIIDWGRSVGWMLDNTMVRVKGGGVGKLYRTRVENGTGSTWVVEHMKITQRHYDEKSYDWKPVFVIWPRRSINGSWLFFETACKRKSICMWGTGFHVERIVEFATLFEVMCIDASSI